MCGFVALLNLDGAPASPVLLKAMADAIAHRGPDGEGVWADGPVGFAHRRLAILDLSPAGHQPMQSSSGRTVLSYNGEVYNHLQLRAELEARGQPFRSRTDSEVVLEGLETWGLDAIGRFNGMFAFAQWDKAARRLRLARDRYGVKPLYYTMAGRTLLAASEIKAFFAHPDFHIAMDQDALVEYMTFQNFLTDRTLFKSVHILPPGCYLDIPADAKAMSTPTRYWDFHFEEAANPLAKPAAQDALDHLFRQAVSRQLMSDVPVGAYLSGGMDSGSITALAARELPNMRSFTVGFDTSSASGLELAFDERAAAERLSYLFKTEHYEMVLKAGDMERCMRDLIWHMEEPRIGQSYPNFYAAKLASRFGKVVLSGAGGDELFAGYPWRYYRAAQSSDFDSYVDHYFDFWQRLLPSESIPGIFAPLGPVAKSADMRGIFRSVFDHHRNELRRPEDYINHSLYFEAKTFLHGLLVIDDKLSMAHGLEGRVPFLDNDLVDFAMRLPVGYKLANLGDTPRLNENDPGPKSNRYYAQNRDGKIILRETMARYVPLETAQAAKQGFSAPDASWFRGESIDFVRRVLMRLDAGIWNYLDRNIGQQLVLDHIEGRHNRRLLIWSLLSLEHWIDVFLEGRRARPGTYS